MDWNLVNYLNYGNTLIKLEALYYSFQGDFRVKKSLIEELQGMGILDQDLADIIKSYGGRKAKKIDLKAFQHDIIKSANLKKKFSEYGCRGFSYTLHKSIEISGGDLYKDVNLRLALMPNEKLYYPPRIRRYLRRVFFNHYRCERFPSICFALGKVKEETCFVFVMQSDLVYRYPSFIRDHFRGWRTILLNSIIFNISSSCRTIYLPKAHDVTKCCLPGRKPTNTPHIWLLIYDRTADDFGFSLEILQEPVNIQVYKDLAPVFVRECYKLDLNLLRR